MEVQLGRHAIPTTVEVSTVLPSAVGSFLIAEDSTVLHPVKAGTTVATERGEETIMGYAWLPVVKWPYATMQRFAVLPRPICRIGGGQGAFLLRNREISAPQFTYVDSRAPFFTTVLVLDTLQYLT